MIAYFVGFLIRNNALDEEYKEESIYGLTIALEKIIAYILLTGVAFLIKKPISGTIFIIFFLMLRQTTGGYHAKSFWGCLAGSVLVFLLAIEVITPLLMRYEIIAGIILIFSSVIIWRFAPVNHRNLSLSENELKEYSTWSRVVLGMESGTTIMGFLLHMRWRQYIMVAIILCAVLILLAKILNQEVDYDED